MQRRDLRGKAGRAVAGACLLLVGLATAAAAGTTGKISGRVLDPQKQPLPGANVAVIGARLGAITDENGAYTILNVPAGTYQLRVSLLSYRTVTVENVLVSADHTTAQDVTLAENPLQLAPIVVTSKRPVIDVGLTSNVATVSRQQIQELPVQELQDVVNLQAGVVDGHFRGGREGEVQYQVDGVTVNNVFNNVAGIRLDRSLLEEVQVISGTFDAEYGQAMSGVVNAVLRRGTDHFTWSGEVLSGAHAYSGTGRIEPYEWRPAAIQNYQLTLSGPLPLGSTVYLLSGRRYQNDSYVIGQNVFLPTDRPDSNGVVVPHGDRTKEPLGYTREWSGVAKITNRSIPNTELNYQVLLDIVDGRHDTWAYRYDPAGLSKQRTVSVVHGLDFTYTFSKSTYGKFSARQNYINYRDLVYPNLFDPRYDASGPPMSDPNSGVIYEGVDFNRYRQKTNTLVMTGSFVSQLTHEQQVKLGGEVQLPRLFFGSPGYLTFAQEGGVETLRRYDNQPPDYPGVRQYRPVLGSAYGQDEIEWSDLRLRAGLRLEYFDSRAYLPSDLSNPANAIAGAPPSHPRKSSKKISLMPRIGVSYPVTDRAAVFFAYGHFNQMPPLGDVFSNADYSKLFQLQAGTADYDVGVLGNPDIKPEHTVQYQFGYRQEITDQIGVDANVFYKDIRDLLGVEFIDTYNDAEYSRLTNVDFGNVIGFTVSFKQRPIGLLSTAIDYTWQRAVGNSSNPRETFDRAKAGEDPRPRQVPLNWDQRHTLNMTITLAKPKNFAVSGILRAASGQPYTPATSTITSGSLQENSGSKPNVFLMDLRGEKDLSLGGLELSAFGRVFNVLDTRFFNGFVFDTSGSPYYSFSPGDRIPLTDPTRYYGPRRIEVGLTFQGGSSR